MRTKNNIIDSIQMNFVQDDAIFPSTRYQGSKFKIAEWVWNAICNINFKTALDAFGGTGSIGYLLKQKNKKVTYNDILEFNWHIGTALIENDCTTLSEDDVSFILKRHAETEYPTFVYDNFKDIYFTNEENQWIDKVVTNISMLNEYYKRSIAFFALFQACIIKRPYNLFHRKNLYIRQSQVKRSFGNKKTWDTSFETHFKQFVAEANNAIFDNNMDNRALNFDVFDVPGKYDLVYIDTPYISKKGTGTDYLDFYHFLEGLVNYNKWEQKINYNSKHRKFLKSKSIWTDKKTIIDSFDKLFNKFQNSTIVVSYRSDGIPSINDLLNLLKKYKNKVHEIKRTNYKYVLSTNRSEEVLIIGETK